MCVLEFTKKVTYFGYVAGTWLTCGGCVRRVRAAARTLGTYVECIRRVRASGAYVWYVRRRVCWIRTSGVYVGYVRRVRTLCIIPPLPPSGGCHEYMWVCVPYMLAHAVEDSISKRAGFWHNCSDWHAQDVLA